MRDCFGFQVGPRTIHRKFSFDFDAVVVGYLWLYTIYNILNVEEHCDRTSCNVFFLLYIYKYDIIEVIALIRLFLLCTWSQCERANSCRPQVKIAYGRQIWIFHQSNVTDNTIRTAGSREHIYYSRQNVKLSLLIWFESNKRTCKSELIVYKPWHPYRQKEVPWMVKNLVSDR